MNLLKLACCAYICSVLPEALLHSLENIKGFNRESFQAVHASGEQVTSVRLNDRKWALVNGQLSVVNIAQHEAFDLQQPIPWCPNAYYLNSRPFYTMDPYLHAGMYYVQEASSMFLWEVLKQTTGTETKGLKVLDLCAAPGGKSTLLAAYFKDGLVVANEVIKSRAAILAENLSKWGSANVVVTSNDPKQFQAVDGYFDVMMIDAPCSGSGLFRRDADAIDEWSPENVLLCSQRQQRISADAYAALKQDGWLIYSTCSYSKEEDEHILDWICETFEVESHRITTQAEWNIVEVQSDQHNAFGYRFYPGKVKGEGFFIAAFQKKSDTAFKQRMPKLAAAGKNETATLHEWLKKEDLFFFPQNDSLLAIPAEWQEDIALLQKNLYLRKAGVTIGSIKGKDLVPHHELGLSLLLNDNIQRVELDLENALSYLKKKEFSVEGNLKGWALAVYKGASLGWMKLLPNRINNYYPVEWRILKN